MKHMKTVNFLAYNQILPFISPGQIICFVPWSSDSWKSDHRLFLLHVMLTRKLVSKFKKLSDSTKHLFFFKISIMVCTKKFYLFLLYAIDRPFKLRLVKSYADLFYKQYYLY